MSKRDFSYSIWWNIILILIGTNIQAIGFKAISAQHHFIPSGLFGLATLLEYLVGYLNSGIWYPLLNIPMFAVGFFFLSRRFFIYSLVAMLSLSLSYSLINFDLGIQNQLYAAISFGVLSGFGGGIVLRSLGSNGGMDVVAIILHQRYNFGLGKIYFLFNFLLFSFSFMNFDSDLVIASMIAAFVSSAMIDYALSMFSQRKLCFIISEKNHEIAAELLDKLKIGATFIDGTGAYKKSEKKLLLVVINNIQLKRLEEIVFTKDDDALFIVENTFSVIGSSFSKRKLY
ncbi:MAG: YitT family protein [Opitutales bacterium]|nr:YitT family protein [Opitutales bacterium]